MPPQILVIYSWGAVPVTLKQALQAYDKLDRNLFTLDMLHIHFICRTKLQLQSKTLIQSQMVETSVHFGVLAGCIKLYPLPLALSLSFKCHVEQEEYYPTRELSARSLEDEGLRRSTVLMNFSPTKLDHDVYGLKGCL
ncbi:hypothetical protein D5086_014101 [Populus alba]|uniref:Uncharacterized protein n=1 Tax=Populus alba TaxID=43335 RepID=A0ACC4C9J5_POPAL